MAAESSCKAVPAHQENYLEIAASSVIVFVPVVVFVFVVSILLMRLDEI